MKKSDVVNIIREILTEGYEYYEVEYYAQVGQHGSVGDFPQFGTAVKKAQAFAKRKDIAQEIEDGDLWYVGVSGSGEEFAIIYINDKYIKSVVNPNSFKDSKSYNNWLKVAKKALSTGKPQKGKYLTEGTLTEGHKLNPLLKRDYDDALKTLNPEILKAANALIKQIESAYRKPLEIRGVKYNGDMFYSDVHNKIKSSKLGSKGGKFYKIGSLETKNKIANYIYNKLKMDGFYLHS